MAAPGPSGLYIPFPLVKPLYGPPGASWGLWGGGSSPQPSCGKIGSTPTAWSEEDFLPDWISVKQAAERTGYSEGHLRHLLGKGKVRGRKFGRDWFTTEEALREYISTNPRPGPKSKEGAI